MCFCVFVNGSKIDKRLTSFQCVLSTISDALFDSLQRALKNSGIPTENCVERFKLGDKYAWSPNWKVVRHHTKSYIKLVLCTCIEPSHLGYSSSSNNCNILCFAPICPGVFKGIVKMGTNVYWRKSSIQIWSNWGYTLAQLKWFRCKKIKGLTNGRQKHTRTLFSR